MQRTTGPVAPGTDRNTDPVGQRPNGRATDRPEPPRTCPADGRAGGQADATEDGADDWRDRRTLSERGDCSVATIIRVIADHHIETRLGENGQVLARESDVRRARGAKWPAGPDAGATRRLQSELAAVQMELAAVQVELAAATAQLSRADDLVALLRAQVERKDKLLDRLGRSNESFAAHLSAGGPR